jgi:hypothetical protein
MDTNATTDDDVKAIKKLGDEFFAGVIGCGRAGNPSSDCVS